MKKFITVFIFISVILFVLTSCVSDTPNDNETAKGRYLEYKKDMYEETSEKFKSTKLKDGHIFFTDYTEAENGVKEYSHFLKKIDGGDLIDVETPKWMDHDKAKELVDWSEDKKGNVYLLYVETVGSGSENTYISSIVKYDDLSESYTDIIEISDAQRVCDINITDDILIVRLENVIYAYTTDEEGILYSVPGLTPIYGGMLLTENELICREAADLGFNSYNLKTGKDKKQFTPDDFPTAPAMKIAADDDNIYIANNTGIYIKQKNGDIWETLIEPDRNSVSTFEVFDFYVSEGVFYILMNNVLYIEKYDENAPKKASKTLKIFSYMKDQTIENAISEFYTTRPDVTIKYEYISMNERIADADVIKKVNTKMLSGDIPDIFIADQMPLEAYTEKGIFMDLSDMVNEMRESGEYINSFLTAYEVDGKIYCVPTLATPVYALVRGEVKDFYMDLKKLAEFSENSSEYIFDPFFYKNTERYIEMMYNYYSNYIYDENGKIKENNLKDYLTDIKKCYNAMGSYNGETHPGNYIVYADIARERFFNNKNIIMVIEDVNAVGIYKGTENINQLPTGKFISSGLVTVWNETKYPEEARDFIKLLLSYKYQYNKYGRGNALNREAIFDINQTLINRINKVGVERLSEFDFELPALETKRQKEEYAKSLEVFKYPVMENGFDDDISRILHEFVPDYLKNKESLEETLSQIMNRIDLMRNE